MPGLLSAQCKLTSLTPAHPCYLLDLQAAMAAASPMDGQIRNPWIPQSNGCGITITRQIQSAKLLLPKQEVIISAFISNVVFSREEPVFGNLDLALKQTELCLRASSAKTWWLSDNRDIQYRSVSPWRERSLEQKIIAEQGLVVSRGQKIF